MKKLLALIAVIAVLMLAGCGQKATGDYNPNYNWVSFSLGNSSFASASTTQMMPGNIRTITLTNPNTMPINFTIADPAGTALYNAYVYGNTTSRNLSTNITSVGKLTFTYVNSFFSNATFPNSSLVSWWPLSENSGNSSQDMHGSNNMTLSSSSMWASSCKSRNCVYFSGATYGYVANGTGVEFVAQPNFTIAMWAYLGASNNNSVLFNKGALGLANQSTMAAYLIDTGNSTLHNYSIYFTVYRANSTGSTYNGTALANANGTRNITLSSPVTIADLNATVNITFQQGNNTYTAQNNTFLAGTSGTRTLTLAAGFLGAGNTATLTVKAYNKSKVYYNVSVNGYALGNFSNNSTAFTFDQANLTSNTNITFSANNTGVIIWNISLSYTANVTTTAAIGGQTTTLNTSGNYVWSIPQNYLQNGTNVVTFSPDANGTNITNVSINYSKQSSISTNYNLGNTTANPCFNATTWCNLGFSYAVNNSTATAAIYLNGTNVSTTSGANATTLSTASPLYFGVGPASGSYYNGYLDEIYLFNTTASATTFLPYVVTNYQHTWTSSTLISVYNVQ